MVCTIVGVRRVDMDDQNVHGFSCYLTHQEDGVTGLMAEKSFVSDDAIRQNFAGQVPSVNERWACSFKRSGKLGLDGPEKSAQKS